MKTFFVITLIGSLLISKASAQSSDAKAPTIDAVVAPSQQIGSENYLLSLSNDDFNNNKYVFYTDSNATVAHIKIDGTDLRLTGGPNPENIMAYACKGYTVILNINKNSNGLSNSKIETTLVIYLNDGRAIVKKVTGIQHNGGK